MSVEGKLYRDHRFVPGCFFSVYGQPLKQGTGKNRRQTNRQLPFYRCRFDAVGSNLHRRNGPGEPGAVPGILEPSARYFV